MAEETRHSRSKEKFRENVQEMKKEMGEDKDFENELTNVEQILEAFILVKIETHPSVVGVIIGHIAIIKSSQSEDLKANRRCTRAWENLSIV